nr:hypothetical protein [Mesorhizobium sp. LCM 4576]
MPPCKGAAHTRSAALDLAFAAELAALVVEWGKAGERRDRLGGTLAELGHERQQAERGGLGDTRHGDHQRVIAGGVLGLTNDFGDPALERLDACVEVGNRFFKVGNDKRVEGLSEVLLQRCPHLMR